MSSAVVGFVFSAALFVVAALITGKSIWWWYVSVSLLLVRLYCQLLHTRNNRIADRIIQKHPELFNSELDKDFFRVNASIFLPSVEFMTQFVKLEGSAAITYASFGSAGYAVICLFARQWGPALLSLVVFLSVPIFGVGNAFCASPEDDLKNSVQRYVVATKRNIKKISDRDLSQLVGRYNAIKSSLQRPLLKS
jgi:hypothetical protein